jgi:hypothetical protein
VALGGATEEERGGPVVGTDPTLTETDGVSRAGAREVEGNAGRWASPRGGVQLVVGREGITGGPGTGKEKREKENGFNLNLKLIFQIYSNLIQSKQDLSKLRKFEINYGWKVLEIRSIFFLYKLPQIRNGFRIKNHGRFYGLKLNGISLENLGTSDFDEI